jgi:hypothetical protein
MCIKVSKKISISGWNVNGLFQKVNDTRVSKLDDIYFKHFMKSDIIFLSENHLSYKDPILYEGSKVSQIVGLKQGRIQNFKLGGAHLKKIAPSGGRC